MIQLLTLNMGTVNGRAGMMHEKEMTAVVTGGARGIGAAIAAGVVERGGRVVVADLDEVRGRDLVAAWGSRASFRRVDVTVEADVSALFAHAAGTFGTPTAVFANAGGVGVLGRLEDTDLDDFRRTTDLLLTSVFLTFKHGIRAMRPLRRGALVATASVAGVRGGLGPHVYTAAKHAVKGLVESAAVEIAPDGLCVNAVSPGGTVSSLSAGLYGDVDDLSTAHRRLAEASSSGRPTTARDVADAALFLATAPRVNGAVLVVDGGDDVLATKARRYYA